ncbi:MAG: type II toxin-antitoxin system HicB family antitoxin [Candidatus Micrarchaeota archaeon]
MKKHTFPVIIQKEQNEYVAYCPSVGVTTQGKTVEKALSNIKEAVELYLEEKEARKEVDERKLSAALFTHIEV